MSKSENPSLVSSRSHRNNKLQSLLEKEEKAKQRNRMKIPTFSITWWLVVVSSAALLDKGGCSAFVVPPVVSTALKKSSPLRTTSMVKMDKEQWMTDVREWFDSVTHPTTRTRTSTSTSTSTTTKNKNQNKANKKNKNKKKNDAWIRQEFEDQANDDNVVMVDKNNKKDQQEPTTRTTSTILSEGKDAWIARDMAKAGKAQDESADNWVANDMNHVGRDPSHQDVQWDMRDAGGGGSTSSTTTRDNKGKKNKKSKNELIQENMKRTGLGTSSDWIQRDMEEAGRGPKEENTRNADKAERLLDKQDKKYKDIYKDMEKAGMDTTRTDGIAERMKTAGRGENGSSTTTGRKEDYYSYKMDKSVNERYDIDGIRTDMEKAGHAESQDWVQQDLEDVGRSHDNVRAKEQPLKRALNRNVPSGIMEDLERVGKAGMSDEWIAKDMERAGHPDIHLDNDTPFLKTRKDRETKEFMASSMAKRTSLKEPQDDKETNQEVPKETKGRILKRTIRKVLKKVIRPWKKWGDLL
jgi:hypothetical protein